jgi:hypothetical protein
MATAASISPTTPLQGTEFVRQRQYGAQGGVREPRLNRHDSRRGRRPLLPERTRRPPVPHRGGGRRRIGAKDIRQRWDVYATNGHGGNVELKTLDPNSFRYSLLRVFDPSTPTSAINEAESHFKIALDTRKHGLNRN